MSTKICRKCKLTKALDDFPRNGKTVRGTVKTRSECKSCLSVGRKQKNRIENKLKEDEFETLKNTESLVNSDDFEKFHAQNERELQILKSKINDRPVSEFEIGRCNFSAEEIQDKLRDYVIHHIPDSIINIHKVVVEERFRNKYGPHYLVVVSDVNFKTLHYDEFMNVIIDRDAVTGHSISVSIVGLEHVLTVANIMSQWFTAKRIQVDMENFVITPKDGLTISWPKNQSIALSQIAILTDFVNDQLVDILMGEN